MFKDGGSFELVVQEFADEGNDKGFLARVAFGDEESDGSEGAVGDFGFAGVSEMKVVDGEKNDEEKGSDALVAVVERVVFDNHIE